MMARVGGGEEEQMALPSVPCRLRLWAVVSDMDLTVTGTGGWAEVNLWDRKMLENQRKRLPQSCVRVLCNKGV